MEELAKTQSWILLPDQGTLRVTGIPGTPTVAVVLILSLDDPYACALLGLMAFIWDTTEFSTIGLITSRPRAPRTLVWL